MCNPLEPISNPYLGSKIDLLDSPDLVTKKIRKAECVPKVVEGNGILGLVEFVILPGSSLKTGQREFRVEREREGLEPLVYTDIEKIKADYEADVVSYPKSGSQRCC